MNKIIEEVDTIFYNNDIFTIGCYVVCINDKINIKYVFDILNTYNSFPLEGYMFTIRKLYKMENGRVRVLLNELVNAIIRNEDGDTFEPGFDLGRFARITDEDAQIAIENAKQIQKDDEEATQAVANLLNEIRNGNFNKQS